MNKQITGFTLIELLIVVAIIGILAAIAVPNFLNAQIRAKVARTKADLKALGTAQEQYFIDHNNYAPAFKLQALTSPVSYIASVPPDVFAPPYEGDSGQGEAYANITWYRYVYGTTKSELGGSQALRNAHCADYWAYYPPFLMRGEASSRAVSEGCPTRYLVKSFGPNAGQQGLAGPNGDDFTLRYDPTNGLVSIGDIAVFGPGGTVQ